MKNLIKVERLRNIITLDKQENPMKMEKVIKSEMLNLLNNYFEISREDISISMLINKEGFYDVQINFISKRCITVNVFA